MNPSEPWVEVVWAQADQQTLLRLPFVAGMSVAEVLLSAQNQADWSCLDFRAVVGYGVFGRRVTEATALHPGDRVELLRALEIDPKVERRTRVQQARKKRSQSG